MYKILVGLALLGSAGSLWAQGTVVVPQASVMSYPAQVLPNTAYYPAMPFTYPAYPAAFQPYYPSYPLPASAFAYPYGAYPNMGYMPNPNAGVPNPVPVPSYTYTSPYNSNQPAMPGPKSAPAPVKKETKPWGDTRYIWPDFYTDQTSDAWDKMINAPHELGYMPGGWRFPSFSSPDPVTVGDAVANQVPPIVEEVPNFMNFTN